MNQLKDRPFALIGVNVFAQSPEELKRAMRRENLNWRSFTVKDSKIIDAWNQNGTPAYYLLDHRGIIRRRWIGKVGAETIDGAVAKLLEEAEAAIRTSGNK